MLRRGAGTKGGKTNSCSLGVRRTCGPGRLWTLAGPGQRYRHTGHDYFSLNTSHGEPYGCPTGCGSPSGVWDAPKDSRLQVHDWFGSRRGPEEDPGGGPYSKVEDVPGPEGTRSEGELWSGTRGSVWGSDVPEWSTPKSNLGTPGRDDDDSVARRRTWESVSCQGTNYRIDVCPGLRSGENETRSQRGTPTRDEIVLSPLLIFPLLLASCDRDPTPS